MKDETLPLVLLFVRLGGTMSIDASQPPVDATLTTGVVDGDAL